MLTLSLSLHCCYENYPMTLHEALACNIPVIATNLGGMAEKIKDGFNGFLFNMGDSRHLQTVLEAIVNDPEGTESAETKY